MMDNTSGIQAASQETPRPARLNPFAFPSDTDLRFILLIVCVLGASLWIYNLALWRTKGDFIAFANVVINCEKSSGLRNAMHEVAEKNPKGQADFQAAEGIYARCIAPIELQDTSRMLGGVALLLIVAGGIYLAFPTWKRWRKRLVPLPPEDLPEVMAELTALCREAGLKRQPQFLWNPLNPLSEGLAFGRMGRYAVALTGGLVKQAYDNPPAFRAVIRHELAHLRNGDIDKTYFSVAIWWAFVITALVPFGAYVIPHSISGLFADLTFSLDASLRVLALTALVLLLRNAVLRARELYADGRASTWDGPAGALDHVLERLPQTRHGRRWKIMQITQTHPEPWTRRAMLHDSWPLLQIGFWDALGAGIAAAIAFTGLDQLFSSLAGSLQISNLPGVLAGLVFGGLAAGVVGSGLWRATCASLMQGKTPRGVGLIALGMTSGIIIGQSLSLSSIGDNLLSFNTLGSFLVGWTAWGLILLLSLWLILRWLVTAATMWLQVTTTTSMLLWSSRVGLVIAGGFWAVCFGTLIVMYSLLSASTAFSSVSLLIEFLLVIVTLLLQPFFVIGLLGLWAFPFAARFWRRRAIATAGAGWAWLEPTPRQAIPSDREPFQFRLALLVGIAGALLFCGLMLALRLWLRLTVPESVREMATFKLALADWIFSRAAVIQGGIAIVTVAWARRSGVLLALFAAFIGGCVMTIGTLGLNLLLGGQINLDFTWIVLSGIIIPGGLLAVLLAPLIALLTKRTGPALRAALVGALIYCGLILGMVISLRFITLKPVTSNLFTSAETTLLVVFQVVVGAIVAARSPGRGWLYGLFAAGITGFVGGSITAPLATTSAITSFAQSSAIILAGASIAIMGTLFALPVVLVVFFAARWVHHSRLRKNAGTPAATTTPTSSTL
jgi:Zn-dependent protease with chaperone function